MSATLLTKQNLLKALLFAVVSFQFVQCDEAKKAPTAADGAPFLEYHFHTYFDANDSVQVAQAVQLRNEIIANCVAKKIIAVPFHWNYDPENPVLECKFQKKTVNWN